MHSNINAFRPSLRTTEILAGADWCIFFLALLATFLAVVYGEFQKRKFAELLTQKGPDKVENFNWLDFVLMGRQLTLPMFVATLVATWYGGIFGVTKIAFEQGLYNFVTQGFFWYVAYLIFAFFMVDKISSYRAVTLPDLINKMFGHRSAFLGGIFNFFNLLPITYTISVGLFIQGLFGLPLTLSMVLGAGLAVLYSLRGGLRGVVFSDLIQFPLMCSAVFLILLLSVFKFGGLDFLKTHLPDEHWHLDGGVGWPKTLAWGFIALSTLVDPNFYQRCFAARTSKVAKRGILISTCIWIGFDLCTTFGAMYARAVIPEANSENAYLIYALQLLPSGLRGLVLAGILATILSTLDSYLFLAGTTLSHDLAPRKWQKSRVVHYGGVIGITFLSIILGIFFEGNIKMVWKTLGSYSAACLLLPMLYGYLFPGQIKDKQFVFSCLLGVSAISFWRYIPWPKEWVALDELYVGMAATTVGLVLTALKKLGD